MQPWQTSYAHGSTIRYQGKKIDLAPPWPRVTVRDAFLRSAGWDPFTRLDEERFEVDLVEKVIPSFDAGRPTVLLDYPVAMASLARLRPGSPPVAERAEVFIGGLELANAYSELNDAAEQEKRFKQEIETLKREGKRSVVMPQRFLEALPDFLSAEGLLWVSTAWSCYSAMLPPSMRLSLSPGMRFSMN